MNTICRSVALGVVVVFALSSAAQAVSYSGSLAGDFDTSNGANSATSVWSFWQDVEANQPPVLALLGTNTRDANDLWGTDFGTPPTMWSNASGAVGIGKNTSGSTQTDTTGTGISWAPDTVLLNPTPGFPGNGRVVVSWRAPAAGIIDASWTFTKATTGGNGVGYMLYVERAVTPQILVNWTGPTGGGPLTSSLTDFVVSAGDRLLWRMDNWDNWGDPPSQDMTLAEITITGELVPEPSSGLLLSLGSAFLVALKRRKKGLR